MGPSTKMSGFSWRLSASAVGAGQLVLASTAGPRRRSAPAQRGGGHRVLRALAARDDHVVARACPSRRRRSGRSAAASSYASSPSIVAVLRPSGSGGLRADPDHLGVLRSGRSPSGRAASSVSALTGGQLVAVGEQDRRAHRAAAPAPTPPRRPASRPCPRARPRSGAVESLVAGQTAPGDARDVGDGVAAADTRVVFFVAMNGKPSSSAAASSSLRRCRSGGGRRPSSSPMRAAREERANGERESDAGRRHRSRDLSARMPAAVYSVRLTGQSTRELELVDFRLSDEQIEFQQYCRKFAREVIRPVAAEVRPRAVRAVGRHQGGPQVEPPRARLHPEDGQRPRRPARRDLRRGAALGLRRHRARHLRLRPGRRRHRLLGHARADRPVGPRVLRHGRRDQARRLRRHRGGRRLRRQVAAHHRQAATATSGCSTAPRSSSRTAASPTSPSSSRPSTPSSATAARPPSSSPRTRPACRRARRRTRSASARRRPPRSCSRTAASRSSTCSAAWTS